MKRHMTFLDIRAVVNELKETDFGKKDKANDTAEDDTNNTRDQGNHNINENINSIDEEDLPKDTTQSDLSKKFESEIDNLKIDQGNSEKTFKSSISNAFFSKFYNISPRIFILRINKISILIELGIRIHKISKDIEKGELVYFSKLLRKHLSRKKIINIYQLGYDRVIVVEMIDYYLVIEMYSGGNLIIVDKNGNKIIEAYKQTETVTKNEKYPFNIVELNYSYRNFINYAVENIFVSDGDKKEYDPEMFKECIDKNQNCIDKLENTEKKEKSHNTTEDKHTSVCMIKNPKPPCSISFDSHSSKLMKKEAFIPLFKKYSKDYLAVEKCIAEDISLELEEELKDIYSIEKIDSFLKKIEERFENIKNHGERFSTAYIPYKRMYNEKSESIKYYDNFNELLMNFYFKEEKKVLSKSESVKSKQVQGIEILQKKITNNEIILEKLEKNEEEIKKILGVLEAGKKNKAAYENIKIVLKKVIDEINEGISSKESDEDMNNHKEMGIELIKLDMLKRVLTLKIEGVPIELSLFNYYENIRKYNTEKKKFSLKRERALNIVGSLVKKLEVKKKIPARKRASFWYEKYFYVILENGILVGGRKKQENEELVKKYLKDEGLYFHIVGKGSSVIFVPDEKKESANPKLMEHTKLVGAQMAACLSRWGSVQPEVFCVKGSQVSKSPQTGEYLTTGSFMIRGTKEMVRVGRLEYGISLYKMTDKTLHPLKKDEINEEDKIFIAASPWIESKNHPYRIRLVHGKVKKGHTVQEIKKNFIFQIEQKYKEKIEEIGDNEIMNVLFTDIRIGKE